VPKTLLAVDDSATMRKVLEITFAGEDFRVVSSDGASGALAKLNEDPVAVVIDTSLVGDDGYALARDVRAKNARTAIVLMASRYNPYDVARGRDAGVDDSIDKPFDTQALIDKVRKAVTARENIRQAAPAQVAPPVAAQAPAPAPGGSPSVTQAFGSMGRPAVPAAAAAPSSAAAPGPAAKTGAAWSNQRTHTLSFEGMQAAMPPNVTLPSPLSRTAPSGITPPQAPPAPAPAPAAIATSPTSAPTSAPAALPTAVPPRAPEPHAATAIAATNGQFAGKLDQLGLTAQQVDAVLALSRELVERVVWEVVPPLAEMLIKEEIARLTKEA
jgi:CheY-like chemotaxis protein